MYVINMKELTLSFPGIVEYNANQFCQSIDFLCIGQLGLFFSEGKNQVYYYNIHIA